MFVRVNCVKATPAIVELPRISEKRPTRKLVTGAHQNLGPTPTPSPAGFLNALHTYVQPLIYRNADLLRVLPEKSGKELRQRSQGF